MLTSLRRQLLALWMAIALACVVVAVLLWGLARHGEKVQVAQAQSTLIQACEKIRTRYDQTIQSTPSGQRLALQNAVLQLVLSDYSGVEGGIWDRNMGMVVYAYPTYEGTGSKTDVPPAELPNITSTSQQALQKRTFSTYVRTSDREVLLLNACALSSSQSAWVMTRVHTEGEAFYHHLTLGLAMLFGVVLLTLIATAWILSRWDQKLGSIESALIAADPSSPEPLQATGSDELDRLGQALNRYARRSVEAGQKAQEMATALARGQRLADMGRMVATIAHEIRNPIATMRLTAENAIADPPTEPVAMERVLAQIERLNGLVESLLTMAQPIKLTLSEVDLNTWTQSMIDRFSSSSDGAAVKVNISGEKLVWPMDSHFMEQALENLLRNAHDHVSEGMPIGLTLRSSKDRLTITVSNAGAPVPDELVARLFEPFATGRTHGNGLGLALVREIALAHEGQVTYHHAEGITRFTMELPWHIS